MEIVSFRAPIDNDSPFGLLRDIKASPWVAISSGNYRYPTTDLRDFKIVEINDVCKEYKTDKMILKNPVQITNEIVKKLIAEGATMVRIGSALFGARNYNL